MKKTKDGIDLVEEQINEIQKEFEWDGSVYTKTPKGVFTSLLGDTYTAKQFMDGLELYMRRNYPETRYELGAIIFENDQFVFRTVQKLNPIHEEDIYSP